MKGICLCCIQNYGLKRFLASSGQKITCAECLAHDVLGVPEEKISELLREYLNTIRIKSDIIWPVINI